ncbi:MAG: putative Ig domain-containing protein [Planctomycetota bacterium]|jgi:hypothetical protein
MEGSIYEHNNYTASVHITFQYSHFGPLRSGCSGNNLKDRSAGTVVRYTWIESGNRQLDLVDGEDSTIISNHPDYGRDFVYGNVLKEDMHGNRQICHYGGDSGATRQGDLYFYNNTIVSTRTDRNTLFRLTSSAETVDMRNNIIYGTLGGSLFEITSDDSDGTCNMSHNWLKPGYTYGGGTVNDDGTSVTGSAPGFVNEGAQDYHITETSACRDEGTSLHSECLPDNNVIYQYVKHQGYESRPSDGTLDIGAFEYDAGGVPDLQITTTSLPDGTISVPYSQTVQATGGVTPYSWSIISGSLPAGLSLNSSTGEISGTPTTEETANFTVQCTDSQDPADTDTQALSITINAAPQPLEITTTSLPDGTVGIGYSQTLQATGGVTPYSWAVISGSLPAGLSLNSSTGEISGTPTTVETANFTVEVTDSDSPPSTDQQALSIDVNAANLVITTTSLPNGAIGSPYSQTLQATGGVTPYTWAVITGSLPAGLSLNSSTGEISGTPTTQETANFTVEVTDSQTPTPDTDTQALSITITAGGPTEETFQQGLNGYTGWEDNWITEDMPNDNFATMASAHLQYITQDRQLHKFDLSSIPAGSTINSATLSIYAYQVTDGVEQVRVYRIITPWVVDEATYIIATSSTSWGVPGLEAGVDYDATIIDTSATVTGPMWVDLDIASLVQDWVDGTYANEGVLLRCYLGHHIYTRMADYSTQADRPKLVVNYTSGGPAPLDITTTSLADGQIGIAYSETLQATGGVTPYSWAVVSGSLPAGLSLNSSTGEISGTPTTGGTSNFTVEVTDSDSPPSTDQQALSIYVPDDLVVTTSSLPDGQIGVGYSETLAATGGVTPYSWSIVSGSLPAGLSLNSGTGEISGTPTTGGTSNFTVRATDSNTPADTDDQALSIYVPDDLVVTTSSLPDGQIDVAYSETLAATGGVTPYSWSIVTGGHGRSGAIYLCPGRPGCDDLESGRRSDRRCIQRDACGHGRRDALLLVDSERLAADRSLAQ